MSPPPILTRSDIGDMISPPGAVDCVLRGVPFDRMLRRIPSTRAFSHAATTACAQLLHVTLPVIGEWVGSNHSIPGPSVPLSCA